MKLYLKPEIKITKFDVEDIMETSGIVNEDNESAGGSTIDGTSFEPEVSIF